MRPVTEIIITSAVKVSPGDKVLLIVPDVMDHEQAAELAGHVRRWAPEADWLLVCGVDTVYQRPDVNFPHGEPARCPYCKGDSAVRKADGSLVTSQEWCADVKHCAADIDWEKVRNTDG